jgi:hypothetical protein
LTVAFPETGSVWARTLEIGEEGMVKCTGFAKSNRDCLSVFETLRETPGVEELQIMQVRGDDPVQFSLNYLWNTRGNR